MDSRNTRQASPLVAAPFAPTREPVLAVYVVGVRAEITAAPGDTRLVAFVISTDVLVAFLSSHRESLLHGFSVSSLGLRELPLAHRLAVVVSGIVLRVLGLNNSEAIQRRAPYGTLLYKQRLRAKSTNVSF